MKKHLNIQNMCRAIVFFEVLMCIIWALVMLTINGGTFSTDHIWWFLLVTLTITSNVLVKKRSYKLNKAILGMAAVPMLIFLLQLNATFFMPYGTSSVYPGAHRVLIVLVSSVY